MGRLWATREVMVVAHGSPMGLSAAIVMAHGSPMVKNVSQVGRPWVTHDDLGTSPRGSPLDPPMTLWCWPMGPRVAYEFSMGRFCH